jgi:hypothetical protein
MRPRLAFIVSVLVVFVVLSRLADGGARATVVTGMVTEWKAGELIAVANEQTDPDGVRITLRDTVYEGDSSAIKPGVFVTVWFKSVGERRFVADTVRVPAD